MGWRTIRRQADELIAWDEPKEVAGVYEGAEERTTAFGENMLHYIVGEDGVRRAFFGTSQLNEALERVTAGTRIRVVYSGREVKTKRGTRVKAFEVQVWEEEAQEEPPF